MKEAKQPLLIHEITERAIKLGLGPRGKIPENTIRVVIERSIVREKYESPYVKVETARYRFKSK